MGSLLDQLQKKSLVIIHISNPQIQQHQYAKMASFKIFLVVVLVAFIGSTDALKCIDTTSGKPEVYEDKHKSCVIVAKIALEGSPLVKPKFDHVTKQACDAKDLKNFTKEFIIPEKIEAGDSITFYCKANGCNMEKEIKDILKENAAKTIEAMKEANEAKITEDVTAGAAQTTVAVATIALSMVMARLAL